MWGEQFGAVLIVLLSGYGFPHLSWALVPCEVGTTNCDTLGLHGSSSCLLDQIWSHIGDL